MKTTKKPSAPHPFHVITTITTLALLIVVTSVLSFRARRLENYVTKIEDAINFSYALCLDTNGEHCRTMHEHFLEDDVLPKELRSFIIPSNWRGCSTSRQ